MHGVSYEVTFSYEEGDMEEEKGEEKGYEEPFKCILVVPFCTLRGKSKRPILNEKC